MIKLPFPVRIVPIAILLVACAASCAASPAAPAINSLSPASAVAGSKAFTLTVYGSNFSHQSVLQWNGTAVTTTFVSSTQIRALVPQANVQAAGTVMVTAFDGRDQKTSNVATFTVITSTPTAPSPLQITTSTLASAQVGSAYGATLAANGGTPPYSWTVVSGSLPPGLALSTTGALSGTPTAAGQYTFAVQARDSATSAQAAMSSLSITVAPLALQIKSTSLPSATVNVAYSATLSETGGTSPYTWVFAGGQLPNGLSLASSGVISGTPTVTGTFPFTVQLQDSTGASTTASLSLAVSSASTRFYSSTSFWNTPIPANPTIDPNSSNMIANSIQPNTNLNNGNDWGIAYVVGNSTDKLYTVTCTTWCDAGASFQVHIPAGAKPSTGGDHHLTVVNGTTEYDMDGAVYNSTNDTWSTQGWGKNDIEGWGAVCNWGNICWYGSVAAGYAGMGGVIRPEEIAQGHVDHALMMAIYSPKTKSFIACPATASDGGSTATYAIPEGARLQLDPSFNVDAQSWPLWEKILAKAMQTYGAYVGDSTSQGYQVFYGQTDQNGGIQWSTVGLSDAHSNGISNFPWGSVRVLKVEQNMGGGVCQ